MRCVHCWAEDWQDDSLPTFAALDAPRVSLSLARVLAPLTPALESLAGEELGLPGGGGQQGAAVGDGQLLPGRDVSPGLQHESVRGGPVDSAVGLTAVVHHGHGGTETPGGVVPERVGAQHGVEPSGLLLGYSQPGRRHLAILVRAGRGWKAGQEVQPRVLREVQPEDHEPEGGAGCGHWQGLEGVALRLVSLLTPGTHRPAAAVTLRQSGPALTAHTGPGGGEAGGAEQQGLVPQQHLATLHLTGRHQPPPRPRD